MCICCLRPLDDAKHLPQYEQLTEYCCSICFNSYESSDSFKFIDDELVVSMLDWLVSEFSFRSHVSKSNIDSVLSFFFRSSIVVSFMLRLFKMNKMFKLTKIFIFKFYDLLNILHAIAFTVYFMTNIIWSLNLINFNKTLFF